MLTGIASSARIGLIWVFLAALSSGSEQGLTVTGHVELLRAASSGMPEDSSNVAVWLLPLDDVANRGEFLTPTRLGPVSIVQKRKTFEPHVLVVAVGTAVAFPNLDPLFHNVFSLFEGKRF